MFSYIYGHHDIVAGFVAQLIPTVRERGFGNCTAIGVVDAHSLVAGIVYHNWEPDAAVIEMSVAALPGVPWLSRETIWRMYDYPFRQLGCQMVVNRIDARNERLLSQCERLGYELIWFPRMLGRDLDGVIGRLTSEAWDANKINQRLVAPPLEEAA
jgi:RimJ/RimL family protein N-acetyltransferase